MTTTSKAICVAARARLATLATSRDATVLFKEHTGNQPFDKTPLSRTEAFEVTEEGKAITSAFGRTGVKEEEMRMVVTLGHNPSGKDYQREDYISRDQDRIIDIIEAGAWCPAGVEAVFLAEPPITDKLLNPNYWITTIVFRVVFASAIETS